MWGGGKWLTMDKVMPGAYHRFVSTPDGTVAVTDRGNAAIGLDLDWGVDSQIVEVEAMEFLKNSRNIFGYAYSSKELKPIREIFKKAKVLYYYRLNGGGEKATCKWADAKYTGVRGNALRVAIATALDAEGYFDVETYLDNAKIDSQRVKAVTELKDTEFVVWKRTAGTLTAEAGVSFSGGTNGTANGESHQAFLDKAERVSFHTLGCNSNDKTTMMLYDSYANRMVDEVGKLFQLVRPAKDSSGAEVKADSPNIIVVENKVLDTDAPVYASIYWVLGASAGCAVNKTLQNAVYDGEYTLDVDYTQSQLQNFILGGKFAFHEAGKQIRVLDDINSMTTVAEEGQEDFKNNQSVRVYYQQLNDINTEFNNFFQGNTPNDQDGRSAFRGRVINYLDELVKLRAIEPYDAEDVTVARGLAVKDIDLTFPSQAINAMHKLYVTVKVS